MKRSRHRFIWIGLTGLVMGLLTGCGQQRTAQQWFDLTWAGLAGVDAFHISGQAEVNPEANSKNARTFTYGADLEQHTRLSVQAVPVRGGIYSSGAGLKKQNGPAALELRDGTSWVIRQEGGRLDAWTAAAAGRVNPLTAIEGLRQMRKNLRLETGGARGTQVLRIEPDSEQELLRLKDHLISEMNSIQTTWNGKTAGSPHRQNAEAVQEGNQLIEASRQQLMQILAGAKVQTIYHLTINKRTNLPVRLTSETRMIYTDPKGSRHSETLWNDARFTDYR
ncbi:hypothetical protein [Paenibacillus pinistramenti]|uniref:hypothetical protein n=1 Tax=Paenibacillus pinistramenti TaxID=1768003 RepID=UPI001109CF86|nr:hypothetical protein [Paenibacillus pinistramenti]